jgi:hypothetical protein
MGEHLCGKAPPSPKSQPASLSNPFTLRQLNANNSKPAQPSPLQFDSPPKQQSRPRAPTAGSSQSPVSRIPRAPLPKINPDAANRPFLAPLPRPESPISPAASSRSGSSMGSRPQAPMRSMTSPVPRLWDPRPPSPELSANLDCAFPPFPFGEGAGSRPGSSNGRNTPSERSSSRADSRSEGRFPDPPIMEPRGPMTKAGDNVMNRMNTLKSGPFDASRRRPSKDERTEEETQPLDRRRPSIPGLPPADVLPPLPQGHMQSNMQPSAVAPAMDRPGRPEPLNFDKMPPQRPARPTESLSPGFLNKLTSEPASLIPGPQQAMRQLQAEDRSKTLPITQSERADIGGPALAKTPSEPSLRGRTGRPSLPDSSNSEPTQIFPSRSTSKAGESRMDYRLQDAPPVPKPVQIHRSNSHHRPSGSDSSTASSAQSVENSNSSSGESSVTSAASSIDAFSPLTLEATSYGEDRSMRVAGLKVKGHENPGMRAEQPKSKKSPPRNFARPAPPKPVQEPEPPLESPVLDKAGNWPLESPMDPGLQNGHFEPREPSIPKLDPSPPQPLVPGAGLSPADFLSDDYDPYRPKSPQIPQHRQESSPVHTRARSKTTNQPPPVRSASPASSVRSRSQTRQPRPAAAPIPHPPQIPIAPPPIPQEPPRQALARRPTVGGKAMCRGCGHVIEGKSVKAADGRLTGRWHKHCFVCKTCDQPFTSADFYVINNNPYCEQHYHEKNGSTCAGCRRGIEGQYLETMSSGPNGHMQRKFHPRCFTCFNCRMVLSEDYFEIAGRVFCERHALAAMRAAPRPMMGPGGSRNAPGLMPHGASGLKAERRTTKLMMMG